MLLRKSEARTEMGAASRNRFALVKYRYQKPRDYQEFVQV